MKMKRFVAVLLVLLMVAAMIPNATAAGHTAKPGDTVSGLSITVYDVYGANGTVTVSGPGSLVNPAPAGYFDGSQAFFYGAEEKDYSIIFDIAVSADAKAGDVITVTFSYEWSDANGAMTADAKSLNIEIVADEETKPTDPTPTDPTPTEPTPTTPAGPTDPTPTEPAPTTPDDWTPIETVDYDALLKQIAIAEALTETDYTTDSWTALKEALTVGKNALYSKSQDVVDSAAQALADAIAALVKMDYSALEEAVAAGEELAANSEVGNLWFELFAAIQEMADLIGEGDQEAVDELAKRIQEIVEKLKVAIEAQGEPEEVIKEVIVEKAPEGEFCNIPLHRLWPILFFVSLAVNVLFVILAVISASRKKKNQKDDTPLVDYDIGDDA